MSHNPLFISWFLLQPYRDTASWLVPSCTATTAAAMSSWARGRATTPATSTSYRCPPTIKITSCRHLSHVLRYSATRIPNASSWSNLGLKEFWSWYYNNLPCCIWHVLQLSDSMSWSHLSKDYNHCGVKAIQICVRDMIKWYIFRNWELSKKNILWCLQKLFG